MPSPEFVEAIDAGRVDAVLGGCCVEEPAPTHECQRCGSRFLEGEPWFIPAPDSVFFQLDGEMTDEQLVALAERIRSTIERDDP
jgi:hypothetical protein